MWWCNLYKIGHKILHRVFREEFLKLAVELRCKRLVVGNDERRLVQPGDHIGHGKGLSGTGDAQKGLGLISFFESFYQCINRLRLIPGRRKLRVQNKMIHGNLPVLKRTLSSLCRISLFFHGPRQTVSIKPDLIFFRISVFLSGKRWSKRYPVPKHWAYPAFGPSVLHTDAFRISSTASPRTEKPGFTASFSS